MQTDAAFLDQLLANPGDHITRLVYADWLEEQGEPEASVKAEFLRLTVQSGKQTELAVQLRLQHLAVGLDNDWLAVVSRLAIENCQREKEKARRRGFRFDFLCERRWEDLRTTADHSLRFCETCQHNVHYCESIGEARYQAEQGHCIALDLGVIRRPGDLTPPAEGRVLMGVISPSAFHEEPRQPDPDSPERRTRSRRARRGQSRWEASEE